MMNVNVEARRKRIPRTKRVIAPGRFEGTDIQHPLCESRRMVNCDRWVIVPNENGPCQSPETEMIGHP